MEFHHKTVRGAAPERESAIHLNCGIGWRTDLAASFARRRSAEGRDEGIGLEGRTSLRERGIGRIGWTLVYGLGAERADGGRHWRHTEQFVAVEATLQPLKAWLVEAWLGTARDLIAGHDSTLWSLAVERAITETVEARAEVGGDDRDRPLMSLALRYLFWPERALVTLSYGVKASPLHERHVGLGITFEF